MLEDLFDNLKLKYYIIFHYGSKNIGYIILKTLLIILFFMPYFLYGIFDFFVEILLLIPSYLPIICIPVRIVCLVLGGISSIFFVLLTLADAFYHTSNMWKIEYLNNNGNLY